MSETVTNPFIVWQLIDSALPTGALSHSGGLESLSQVLGVKHVSRSIEILLCQNMAQQLPLLRRVYAAPATLESVDEQTQALLSNHVARRASIAQGRALVSILEKMYSDLSFSELRARIRMKSMQGHFIGVFAWSVQALGLSRAECEQAYLFVTMRDLFSSAIRLGICGPMEAQRLQQQLQKKLLAYVTSFASAEPRQINPIQEIVHGMHDRLYSRLFAS